MNQLIQRRIVQLLAQARQLEAEDCHEEAVNLREEICQLAHDHLGEDHPFRTDRLIELAAAYRRSRKLDRAEEIYLGLIARLDESIERESLALARSLNALGVLYCETARHAQATYLFERALNISRRQLPGGDPGFAAILNNLAGAHHVLRQFSEAECRYQEALVEYEREGSGALEEQADCLRDLAELAAESGQAEVCDRRLQRALNLYRGLHLFPESKRGEALVRLARLAHRIERTSQAVELLEEAAAIFQRAGEEQADGLAFCLDQLSELHRNL